MILDDFEDCFGDMPPKRGRRGVSDVDEEDEEYRRKRDRNNEAVKKSRFKSKQKTQETCTRVNSLKAENRVLEDKVKNLTNELKFLKELFLAHASNKDDAKLDGIDLQKLLEDTPEEKKS